MVNDADGDVLTDCAAEGDEADSADREADTLAPKVSDGVRDAERVPLLEGEAAATERERDAKREALLEGEAAARLREREALTDRDVAPPRLGERDALTDREATPPLRERDALTERDGMKPLVILAVRDGDRVGVTIVHCT